MQKSLLFVMAVWIVTILACGFNVSTANITEAQMAADSNGNTPTTVFAPDDTFYAVVQVANAPDDTTVKAVWVAVEVENVDPDFVIGEKELQGGGTLTFSLSNAEGKIWPAGDYKADIYLNDELDRSLSFTVEGEAVAEEVEPDPTNTPDPEPTATPAPEPTEPPEAEPAPAKGSMGDTLAQPTPAPGEESSAGEAEALPFQDAPYVHPSGAFSFGVPQGWEVSSEDDTSVTVGSEETVANFSSMFMDAGRKFSEKEMADLSDELIGIFTAGSDDYEVLAREQDEDGLYAQVQFELMGVDVIADFFFIQRDTVLFVLNFIAVDYDALLPTWEAIIDSYEIDLEVARSIAPEVEEASPPSPATPVPPPGPSIPTGKGMFVFNNQTGGEFVVDVIGPTNTSEVVPPNSAKEFVLDPGHYIINGHSPLGDYYIEAYEFDIEEGRSFKLDLNP